MILQYFTIMLKMNDKVHLLPMLMTLAGEIIKQLLMSLLVQKKKKFNVGSECSKTFHYLGLDLNPNERKQIYLNQTKCIKI